MATPLLQLNHATVLRGARHRALDDISLIIAEQQHTAILGPNGSGKSTLMQLISRHLYPQPHADGSAAITIAGRERWDVFELRSLLGIITPDLQLAFGPGGASSQVSAERVVLSGFFASYDTFAHHTITAAMRRQGAEALERVGATHLADKPLAELSTGEARRVVIARALAPQPRALLLDEPTTGLDLLARHRFLAIIEELAQQGTTIILVTHHVEEVIPSIQQVLLLRSGRVFFQGDLAGLNAATFSALFGAALTVERQPDGYFTARLAP